MNKLALVFAVTAGIGYSTIASAEITVVTTTSTKTRTLTKKGEAEKAQAATPKTAKPVSGKGPATSVETKTVAADGTTRDVRTSSDGSSESKTVVDNHYSDGSSNQSTKDVKKKADGSSVTQIDSKVKPSDGQSTIKKSETITEQADGTYVDKKVTRVTTW